MCTFKRSNLYYGVYYAAMYTIICSILIIGIPIIIFIFHQNDKGLTTKSLRSCTTLWLPSFPIYSVRLNTWSALLLLD